MTLKVKVKQAQNFSILKFSLEEGCYSTMPPTVYSLLVVACISLFTDAEVRLFASIVNITRKLS